MVIKIRWIFKKKLLLYLKSIYYVRTQHDKHKVIKWGNVGRRFHFSCVTGSTSSGSLETGIPTSAVAQEIKENMLVDESKRSSFQLTTCDILKTIQNHSKS